MNDDEKDIFIARTQRNLSYVFLAGYFSMLVMRGMGFIEGEFDLNEAVMLVLTFWFLRARPGGAQDGTRNPPKGGE